MFAVPGWKLDSKLLKTQTELPTSSSTKKRKRRREKEVAAKVDQTLNGPPPSTPTPDSKPNKHKKPKSNKSAETRPPKPPKSVNKPPAPSNAHNASTKPRSPPTTTAPLPTPNPPSSPPPPNTTLTPLQSSMRQKLISSRFRHLNETLYTTTSASASALLAANPTFFTEYHAGFRQQVAAWPSNPVSSFLSDFLARAPLRSKPQHHPHHHQPSLQPLPRTAGTSTIADLGAGDAALAHGLTPHAARLRLRLLSYDLAAANPLVTAADIAALPLPDGAVDVGVLCLALMGTNWLDFVDEAWRVLRWRGELWVAEIRSRFADGRGKGGKRRGGGAVGHSVGRRRKEEEEREELAVEVDGARRAEGTEVEAFVAVLRRRGFSLVPGEAGGGVDLRNKMFAKMRFVKDLRPMRGKNVRGEGGGKGGKRFVEDEGEDEGFDEASVLQPCLYKVR